MKSLSHHALLPLLLLVNAPTWAAQEPVAPAKRNQLPPPPLPDSTATALRFYGELGIGGSVY
ncbi:hypothetical protein DMW50_04090, partial [Serratia marcescens]